MPTTWMIRLAGACALLFGAGALAQQGGIDARTFDQLTRAQELAEANQYDEAIAVLDELKGSDRLNSYAKAQLWNFYAFIYANQEQYDAAIKAYRNVLREPDSTDGLKQQAKYTMAQLYFQTEQYDQCIRFMESWLSDVDQPTPTAHIMLAQAYYQNDAHDKALENLDIALRLDREAGRPVQESWLRLKAAIYFGKKDYANTAKVFEQLITISPQVGYMKQLAGMYSELGRDAERLAVFDAIHQHGALTSESDLVNLAYMWLGQQVPYRAGRILEEGIKAGRVEESQKNLETLANAWAQANERDKAVPALTRAAEVTGDGIFMARLAGVHFNAGEYREAAAAAAKADQMGGLKNSAGNLMLLGMAHFNAKSYENALQAFRRAKQDRGTFKAAAKWEQYTLDEVRRLRAIEEAQRELERRTREALEAEENNVEALGTGA